MTPVDAGIARPLIEGLSTETIVTDDSARRLFDIEPAQLRQRSAKRTPKTSISERPERAAGRAARRSCRSPSASGDPAPGTMRETLAQNETNRPIGARECASDPCH